MCIPNIASWERIVINMSHVINMLKLNLTMIERIEAYSKICNHLQKAYLREEIWLCLLAKARRILDSSYILPSLICRGVGSERTHLISIIRQHILNNSDVLACLWNDAQNNVCSTALIDFILMECFSSFTYYFRFGFACNNLLLLLWWVVYACLCT